MVKYNILSITVYKCIWTQAVLFIAWVVALFQDPQLPPLVHLVQWYMLEMLMIVLTLPGGLKSKIYKALCLESAWY